MTSCGLAMFALGSSVVGLRRLPHERGLTGLAARRGGRLGTGLDARCPLVHRIRAGRRVNAPPRAMDLAGPPGGDEASPPQEAN